VTLRGSDLQGLGAGGAATKSVVNVIRTGFSTHCMVRVPCCAALLNVTDQCRVLHVRSMYQNMGQRYLQLYVLLCLLHRRRRTNLIYPNSLSHTLYPFSQAKYVHCQFRRFSHPTRFPNAAKLCTLRPWTRDVVCRRERRSEYRIAHHSWWRLHRPTKYPNGWRFTS
jgi:hypothetical protein